MKLQGRYSGYATDDVIVFARDEQSNREAKLIAQIKHAPAITKSDGQFAEVIQAAWSDFNNPALFDYSYDALALITGPLSASDTYDVRELLEMARTSQDATDFFEKVNLANFSSVGKKEKLEVFLYHIAKANSDVPPPIETTWRFLRSFHLLGYDLDLKTGVSLSLLHSLIGVASPDNAESVWLKILNEVQSWNPRAGVLTLQSLPQELLDHFRVSIPPALPVIQATPIRETIAAALIGAWDENRSGDRDSIERFTGMSFKAWQDKIRDVWLTYPGTFDQKDGKWRVIDRLAFWSQEGPKVNDSQLEQFKDLASTVLREEDPALELDPEDRFAAGIYGKVLAHSGLLRKGVAETIALLGAAGGALSTCSFRKPQEIANATVSEILAGGNWRIWASVNDVLPLLAEGSPDEFLNAVQAALAPESQVFGKVFNQETGGIFGRTYITGVLWGLENLAWTPDHLVSVARILADLCAVDPGGNWSNRPLNSLTMILLPWLPQTSAPTEKRHAAVKVVTKRNEEVGWKLVCALLPQSHASSSGTHKPVWQKFVTVDYKDGVPGSQYWEDILFYFGLALELAGNDVDRLANLVDTYFQLPSQARQNLRDRLSSEEVRSLDESLRYRLWESLNCLTSNHRKFADSENWRVPEGSLEELDVIADRLSPSAPEIKHKRLFAGDDFNLYEDIGNHEEQEARLAIRRREAVKEVYRSGGRELLITFAREVSEPWSVGSALGSLNDFQFDAWILPEMLAGVVSSLVQFAGGFVRARFRSAGWTWVDSLPIGEWSAKQRGQFFAFLPFCEETWERVARSMVGDEGEYWLKTSPNANEATSGLADALEKLVSYDRPDAALRCMQSMIHRKKPLQVEIAIKALKTLKSNHGLDAYAVGKVLSYLQREAPSEESKIRELEWKFMPILGRFNKGQALYLSRWLAEDPDFFCEVIQTVYRSQNLGDKESADPSPEAKAKAQTALSLLSEWKRPPGTLRDNSFSGETLNTWVSMVKRKCLESGHWGVASSQIGQVLRYSPVDEEGLWIEPVCAILDEDSHNRMRDGLTMEIFNGRGTYTPDGGTWEASAATKWEKLADRAENKGYALLARQLRRLATSYRHDAEREGHRGSHELD